MIYASLTIDAAKSTERAFKSGSLVIVIMCMIWEHGCNNRMPSKVKLLCCWQNLYCVLQSLYSSPFYMTVKWVFAG